MRAVLRRAAGPCHPHLEVRDLEIDLASRVVKMAGEPVQLSAKEYELLVALAEDPERVFKKEELLRKELLWSSKRRSASSAPGRLSPSVEKATRQKRHPGAGRTRGRTNAVLPPPI
jgi:hypothetical protein